MHGGSNGFEPLEGRRHFSAGNLDPKFGSDGVVSVIPSNSSSGDSEITLAAQPDGKFIAAVKDAGTSTFSLRRYLSNGKIDTAFQSKSIEVHSNVGMSEPLIDSKSRIDLIIGQTLWRFHNNGTLDRMFSLGNAVETDYAPVRAAFDSNGDLLLGSNGIVSRYDLNHRRLDSTFGKNGIITLPHTQPRAPTFVNDLDVQSDGKILLTVQFDTDGLETDALMRYTARGALDTSYGQHGSATTPDFEDEGFNALQTLITPTGAVTMGSGEDGGSTLFGFTSDGSINHLFGDDGVSPVPFADRPYGFAFLPHAGGFIYFGSLTDDGDNTEVSAFTSDGAPDPTFSKNGSIALTADTGATGVSADAIILPNGRIVLGTVSSGDGGYELYGIQTTPLNKPPALGSIDKSGTLIISGTRNDDFINLDQMGSTIVLTIGSDVQLFDASKVLGIRIDGGDGNDSIQATGLVSISMTVHGGAGDDYIFGTHHADHLYGDQGNDSLFGSFGNDILWGGIGQDTMTGGSGDDEFHATDGSVDSLDGGTGFDKASADRSKSIRDEVLGIDSFV